ncbi:MAG: flavodoxin family protein [Candidatus Bathyarchaeota archaeon]|nr:flavodoxin family protein [Candidatus Bathyarchaeota archaeon]
MKMRKGIVAYDSNFGNTEKIARALARGLEEKGVEVDCLRIDEVDVERLAEYDFIAVGGPTHMIRTSKPMKAFLERLRTVDLRGLKGFSFDTRNESRMNGRRWLLLENSAARVIEGVLKSRGVDTVKPRHSAIVEGREGPLYDGMEELFTQMGAEIAGTLQ